jgi:hypothetical protein
VQLLKTGEEDAVPAKVLAVGVGDIAGGRERG